MWYKTGTVTYKAGSAVLTGKDTLWADDKMGITPGDLVLISITDDNVMMAEVNTIKSNTEIELRTAFNKDSITDTKYAIINTLNETIADFAKRISATILYFQTESDKYKDLDARVTKQVANILGQMGNFYTKAQSDAGYAAKNDTYTKVEADGRYYTKQQADAGYAAKTAVYTKGESDGRYFRNGVIGEEVDIAWNKPTGIYMQKNTGDTHLVTQFYSGVGSARSAQLKFDYQNRNIHFRSSRDGYGFEKPWTKIYTELSKPTPAELGALPVTNPVINGTPEVSGNGYSGYRMRATDASCPATRRFTLLEKNKNGAGFSIITRGEDGKNDGVFTFPAGQSGEVFHTGRLPTKGQLAEGIFNGQVISTGDHGLRNHSSRHIRFEYTKNDGTQATDAYIFKDGVDHPSRRQGLRINTGTPNKASGNTQGSGDWVFGEDGLFTTPGGIQVGTTGKAQVMIGDNDSGLKSQEDGAVRFWANNQNPGFWNSAQIEYRSFVSTHADGLRLLQGNKGFIFRQDGANMYFLLSTENGGRGTWTGHRPLTINMTDATVSCGTKLIASVQAPSDFNLKYDINKIDSALSKVEQLNGYSFFYKKDDVPCAGLIAQEVLEVLPQAVWVSDNISGNDEDKTDYLTVDHQAMSALYVESIKELAQQNRELKAANEKLQSDMSDLLYNLDGRVDARVQSLEMRLEALYNMKVNGVSSEAPPINNEETP